MPVNAAGCLIDPPVSVPVAAKHRSAATAAADPPDEPPGVNPRSSIFQGMMAFHYMEVSLELPIANSSIFVFPNLTVPL